MSSQKGEDS